MQYFMINTTSGEPITVVSKGSIDHGDIHWVDGAYCVNEIHHIQVRGRHIAFMTKERHIFARIECQDFAEAQSYAHFNFGYIVEFDAALIKDDPA